MTEGPTNARRHWIASTFTRYACSDLRDESPVRVVIHREVEYGPLSFFRTILRQQASFAWSADLLKQYFGCSLSGASLFTISFDVFLRVSDGNGNLRGNETTGLSCLVEARHRNQNIPSMSSLPIPSQQSLSIEMRSRNLLWDPVFWSHTCSNYNRDLPRRK